MKTILIGMMTFNAFLAYGAQVDKCSFYLDETAVAKNKITKALVSNGYKKVSHLNQARYLVESGREAATSFINIVDLDDSKTVFASSYYHPHIYNMNPVLKELKGRFEKCL